MKILFANHYAGAFGGVEAYVLWTAKALAARGHSVHLARLQDTGVEMENYLTSFESHYRGESPKALAAWAEQLRPDVVFLHKLEGTRFFLELKPVVRLVRYVHDHDLCCPRRHKYYFWNSEICRQKAGLACFLDLGFLERKGSGIFFRSAKDFFSELDDNRRLDTLIVGSRFMQDELLMNGFQPQTVSLIPPLPPPSATFEQEVAPSETDYIFYAGQLIRGKGVDVLLRAFALLVPEFPKLGLIVAGAGNASEKLQNLNRRLGLQNKVRFVGRVSGLELQNLYRNCLVVAVPSRWPEPFGMVGLEAMGHGKPVVGADAGGIRDWLDNGKTGLLCKPGIAKDLARVLKVVLSDPEKARAMGKEGNLRTLRNYNYTSNMDTLEVCLSGGH